MLLSSSTLAWRIVPWHQLWWTQHHPEVTLFSLWKLNSVTVIVWTPQTTAAATLLSVAVKLPEASFCWLIWQVLSESEGLRARVGAWRRPSRLTSRCLLWAMSSLLSQILSKDQTTWGSSFLLLFSLARLKHECTTRLACHMHTHVLTQCIHNALCPSVLSVLSVSLFLCLFLSFYLFYFFFSSDSLSWFQVNKINCRCFGG